MSQIILINGIFDILVCGLFLFYVNKYRYLMSKTKLVILSIVSLYFLFLGFLKIRASLEINIWDNFGYSVFGVFNITNSISSLIIIIFLYFNIEFKGKIIKNKNNDND